MEQPKRDVAAVFDKNGCIVGWEEILQSQMTRDHGMTLLKEGDGYYITGEKIDDCPPKWKDWFVVGGSIFVLLLCIIFIIRLDIPSVTAYGTPEDAEFAILSFFYYVGLTFVGLVSVYFIPGAFTGCGIKITRQYTGTLGYLGEQFSDDIRHYQFSDDEVKDAEAVKEIIQELASTAEQTLKHWREATLKKQEEEKKKNTECCTRYRAVIEKVK